ncbi:MAG: hypothetical protein M1840_000518 [Geoglossum simile]|nr:MAG: hypothetical protein M1840_000518 [Geoglossum simile]
MPLLALLRGRSVPGNLLAANNLHPPSAPSPVSDPDTSSAEMGDKLGFMGLRCDRGEKGQTDIRTKTRQTILIPALISLVLYLLTTYVFLPLFRRHRQRYSQYLPLPPSSTRLRTTLFTLFPSQGFFSRRNRTRRHGADMGHSVDGGDIEDAIDGAESSVFDDEEGEDMVGFDIDEQRREALERRRNGANRGEVVRLSRDLEEGFRDDSSDEEEQELELAPRGLGRPG